MNGKRCVGGRQMYYFYIYDCLSSLTDAYRPFFFYCTEEQHGKPTFLRISFITKTIEKYWQYRKLHRNTEIYKRQTPHHRENKYFQKIKYICKVKLTGCLSTLIHTEKQPKYKYRKHNSTVFLCFPEASKAFDRINHKK